MTIKTDVIQPSSTARAINLRFDWLFSLATIWQIGGLFLDGYAHNHNMVDTSFFTPWHAVFYSGYAAVAVVLLGKILWNMRQGKTFRQAIPAGYELSTLGVAIFGFGGGFDLLWHTLFGIERGIEALYSPSHLMLALGMLLIVSGPLRAAWGAGADKSTEREKPSLMSFLPVIVSIILFFSVLTFFLQGANPFVNTLTLEGQYRPADHTQADVFTIASSSSMLLQTAVMMAVILLVVRRWHLPFGSLTLLMLINALMMCTQGDQYRFVPGALATGLIGDMLITALKVSPARKIAVRAFAFLLPVIFWGLYLLSMAMTSHLWWSSHVWAGVILETGALGLLLSFLVTA